MYMLRRKKKRDTKGETHGERQKEKEREKVKLSTLERIYFPISHKLLNKMPSIKQKMSKVMCQGDTSVFDDTKQYGQLLQCLVCCCGFNKNGPHRFIDSGTTMRCDLVRVDVAFLKKVCRCQQVLTSASFRSRCKTLSSSPAHCVPS